MRALSEFIHFLVINDLLLRRSSIDIRSAPLRLIFLSGRSGLTYLKSSKTSLTLIQFETDIFCPWSAILFYLSVVNTDVLIHNFRG
jgi:hypothetical protein